LLLTCRYKRSIWKLVFAPPFLEATKFLSHVVNYLLPPTICMHLQPLFFFFFNHLSPLLLAINTHIHIHFICHLLRTCYEHNFIIIFGISLLSSLNTNQPSHHLNINTVKSNSSFTYHHHSSFFLNLTWISRLVCVYLD